MAALRYLVFGAIGIVVALVLFLAINFVVNANMEAGTGLIERWLLRNLCSQFELRGSVRDTAGRPVAFAVVEVSYLDERLTTRVPGMPSSSPSACATWRRGPTRLEPPPT